MPTHFHFVVEVADDVLSPGMHGLFGPYAQAFNKRHGRSGHLRAEPYKLNLIADERGLLTCSRYVYRNPVRAGLCATPQDWPWSSYRGSAEYGEPFDFVDDSRLLACFHEDPTKAVQQLRAFIESE